MSKIHFLHPEYLYFLIALLLPLIVHLFNFRRVKKVYFTRTKYLEEVEQKQDNFSKLKRYLLLFSRTMAILFLVLAVANPYYGDKISVESKSVSVLYLDNSFSMQSLNNSVSLLNKAKSDIKEVYQSNFSEQLYLMTNNSLSAVSDEMSLNLALSDIDYSSEEFSISAMKSRAKDILNREGKGVKLTLFSDLKFKNGLGHLDSLNSEIKFNTKAYYSNSTNNVSLDSIWIDRIEFSKSSFLLNYKLTNYSSNDINFNETIYLDSNVISSLNRSFKANSDSVLSLRSSLKSNSLSALSIELNGDDIYYDNKLFFSLELPEKIKVLHKGTGNYRSLNSLKRSSNLDINFCTHFNFPNFNLKDFDFLVYSVNNNSSRDIKSINDFIEKGRSVLIFPSENCSKAKFNSFLKGLNYKGEVEGVYRSKLLTTINYDSSILKDLFADRIDNFDYPEISYGFKISCSKRDRLLSLDSGDPLLLEYKTRNSNLYIYSSSIFSPKNSFATSDLSTLIYYKLASSKMKNRLYYTIYKDPVYKNTNSSSLELEIDGSRSELYSLGNDEFLIQHIDKSGNHKLFDNDQNIDLLSLNYDRSENLHLVDNDIEKYNIIKLEDLKNLDNLIYLWKWCLTFTMLFLLMEFLVINLLKD